MEEKKYYIDESKIAGDKVCEPSPAYRSAASASSASSASDVSEPMMAYSSLHHAEMEKEADEWDEVYNTDSYPMGRSLEQVMEHCEEVEKYLDDPDYWISIDEFEEQMRKAIPGWK